MPKNGINNITLPVYKELMKEIDKAKQEVIDPANVLNITDWLEYDEEIEGYRISLEHYNEVIKHWVISYDGILYYLNINEDLSTQGNYYSLINDDGTVYNLYFELDTDDFTVNFIEYPFVSSNSLSEINGSALDSQQKLELLPIVIIEENKSLQEIYNLIPRVAHTGNTRKTCILRIAGSSLPAVIRTDWIVSLSPTYSNYYNFYIKKLEKVADEFVDTGTSTETLTFNDIVNTHASTYRVQKLRLYKHSITFVDSNLVEHSITLITNDSKSVTVDESEFTAGINLISASDTDSKSLTYFFYYSDTEIDISYADGTSVTFSNVTNVSDTVTELF